MRALILAAGATVAAVALGGCTLVTPAIDQATDTTIAERCAAYRTELDFHRAALTAAQAIGSPKVAAIAAAIVSLETFMVESRCPLPAPEER